VATSAPDLVSRGTPTPARADAQVARDAAMRVSGVSKHYKTASGSVHALEDIDLDVQQGEFVTILGPSGCGKTTLLWGMSGLHDLTRGTVTLNGSPVTGPRPEIGMIFQEANLLPWRNLARNIRFPFEIKRIDSGPYEERIAELLNEVGWPALSRSSRASSPVACSSGPASSAASASTPRSS
jgi:NitT/TauT family transport system ATP-binding protein